MNVLVTGAKGFLGQHVCAKLKRAGISFIETSLRSGVDLCKKDHVWRLFQETQPQYVIHCAAFVGGIQFGYKYPAKMFYDNLMMGLHILEASHTFSIKRLINPISNCVYPAQSHLFKESELWDGPLHESVQAYGCAKKSLCTGAWAYHTQYNLDTLTFILSNMYGPGDHFEEERSHAIGAIISKVIQAKRHNLNELSIWGTGTPVREWLYVEDGAEALVRGLTAPSHSSSINIGVGVGISIHELTQKICKIIGYTGKIIFDATKPDGAPFKTVDGTQGAQLLDWKPQIQLEEGLHKTIDWYAKNFSGEDQ